MHVKAFINLVFDHYHKNKLMKFWIQLNTIVLNSRQNVCERICNAIKSKITNHKILIFLIVMTNDETITGSSTSNPIIRNIPQGPSNMVFRQLNEY